jgi:hypothetical protein
MTAITNEHALALIALAKAEAEGDRRAITDARIEVAKHEAKARRALLTPEQRAKLEMVTENIGTLLAHTHVEDTDSKKGRVRLVTDPDYIHLTFKERP